MHPGDEIHLNTFVVNNGPDICPRFTDRIIAHPLHSGGPSHQLIHETHETPFFAATYALSNDYTTTIDADMAADFYNVYSAITCEDDPDGTNNSGYHSLVVRRPTNIETQFVDVPNGAYFPGDEIEVTCRFIIRGPAAAVDFSVFYFLSDNPIIHPQEDVLLDEFKIPYLEVGVNVGFPRTVRIPSDLYGGGDVYIGVMIYYAEDPDNTFNAKVDPAPIYLERLANLEAVSVAIPARSTYAGGTIPADYEVFNHGPRSSMDYTLAYYGKQGATYVALSGVEHSQLDLEQTVSGTDQVELPVSMTPGIYQLEMRVEYSGDQHPSNDVAVATETFTVVPRSDLALQSVSIGTGPYWCGSTHPVTASILNLGSQGCPGYTVRYYASGNEIISGLDEKIGEYDFPALGAGSTVDRTRDVTLPPDLAEGDYYIGALISYAGDPEPINNTAYDPDSISTYVVTDLRAVSVVPPPGPFHPGDPIVVANTTANDGPSDSPGYTARLYLSPDTTILPNDVEIVVDARGPLAAGVESTVDNIVAVPWVPFSGEYYIGLIVSSNLDPDTIHNRVCSATPVTIQLPSDLEVTALDGPEGTFHPGDTLDVANVVRNLGPDDCFGYSVKFYASTDRDITETDTFLAMFPRLSLLVDRFHSTTNSVVLPASLVSGSYFIGMMAAYTHDTQRVNNAWADVEAITVVADDAYEENDTRGEATSFAGNWERTWLSKLDGPGIQDDEDWYRIEVGPAGYERVMVQCAFTHTDGDINLVLLDATGAKLADSTTPTDNEDIDFTVPGPGTYYILVHDADRWTPYDLWWDDVEVAPAAEIVVAPIKHDFGPVRVGQFAEMVLVVANRGSLLLVGTAEVALPFSIVSGGNYKLNADETQEVRVRFLPAEVGVRGDSILFSGGGGAVCALKGEGRAPSPEIVGVRFSTPTSLELEWTSVSGGLYRIMVTRGLTDGFPKVVEDGIPGKPPRNIHAVPRGGQCEYFRVEVE